MTPGPVSPDRPRAPADDVRLSARTEVLPTGAAADSAPTHFPPLMAAAAVGDAGTVASLLAAGADPLALEPVMGATAMHKAAQAGSADVLGLLLDHGAFLDQQSPVLGNTPLIDAVLHKHDGAVRLLLERGARTSVRNHWQQSPLDLARHDGLDEIARLIETRDRHDAARTRGLVLFPAVEAGDAEEVARLVAAGAEVDEQAPVVGAADDAYTALAGAARAGDAGLAGLLLDAGADPRRAIGLMQGTPLHEAAFFGHADVIRALTRARPPGAAAPALDAQGAYNGLTALHDATWHGHVGAVRALLEAGARVDLRTHAGLTPRQLAVLYGYAEIADLLAAAGG